MPAAMVDLKKTEAERSDRAAKVAEETTRMISEEDKAVRAQQEEVLKIPQDPGVYMLEDGKTLHIFKLAESTYHTNKGRAVWRRWCPSRWCRAKARWRLRKRIRAQYREGGSAGLVSTVVRRKSISEL